MWHGLARGEAALKAREIGIGGQFKFLALVSTYSRMQAMGVAILPAGQTGTGIITRISYL
jgi:hypothetical protein